ncbi:MAG: nitrilase-related carbon-nitrogen hydrolase, partial [Actinomycetota bacterium]
MEQVRAAVVQAAPVPFDVGATLERVRELATEAAGQGVQLAVFPEAFVGGYPKGSSFGAVVGHRSDEGREDFQRYFEGSVEVPGPAVEELSQIAAEHALHLVVGVIERGGGTLYCTVVFVGPDGGYLGKHRKLMPTAAERLVWGFGDGSTMPVLETALGRIGAVICWENYMPAMRLAMYSKGIEIYCAPTADSRRPHASTMQHIALEGRCFVLAANQFTRRADFPEDYENLFGEDPETIISSGGSCIVSPFGRFLAGPVYDESTLLVADLDMNDIKKGKYDFDVVGHYARPDVFHLDVNEAPMSPVSHRKDPSG